MTLTMLPAGQRDPFLPLLRLADDSEQQVRGYMNDGDLYVYSASGDSPSGIVLVVPFGPNAVELKAVAIDPSLQKQGIGQRMLAAVLAALRGRGFALVRVGTANAAIGELAFHQKVGFRLTSIERDFFTPARGYAPELTDNGIRLHDMVWLELDFAVAD